MSLPTILYRVEWEAGYGWPLCTHRERTHRNYQTARAAGEQVASIRAWPDHHILVGVWMTNTAWTEFDPDVLPQPESK